MLIRGALTGIQDFLFAIPEAEGGQARMLRARSFYLQLLSEVLALRVQDALGLGRESLVLCAAGTFTIEAPDSGSPASARLEEERAAVERWLIGATAGRIGFALAWDSGPTPETPRSLNERLRSAEGRLRRAKLTPWRAAGTNSTGEWTSQRLIAPALDIVPAPAFFEELGKRLPGAKALLVSTGLRPPQAGEATLVFDLAGYRVSLLDRAPGIADLDVVLASDLAGGLRPPASWPAVPWLRRPLARHVPVGADGAPLTFEHLARRARGAPLLGVLKMDADSLGEVIASVLGRGQGIADLSALSEKLDRFFATELDADLRHPPWDAIYTVFSGGDDLLLVGPWDVMLDFAGHVRTGFQARFGADGMTISGGLAIVKHRHPIRSSATQADDLLATAKTQIAQGASSPKDQLACLGQVWKWQDHAAIVAAGRRLADWVTSKTLPRGRLQTLLHLADERLAPQTGAPRDHALATARLAYHIARNYPTQDARDPAARSARAWADRIAGTFDQLDTTSDSEARYLPAIVRYALLATRSPGTEDDR